MVVLPPATSLYSTPTAALAAKPGQALDDSPLQIARVVSTSDAGVIEVRFGERTRDCAEQNSDRRLLGGSWPEPWFAIDAFVATEQLIPRLSAPMIVEHPDGTGASAQQGAPLKRSADGKVSFLDPLLAQALGSVDSAQVTWSTPEKASVPTWTREAEVLTCDPSPEPERRWRERQREERLAAVTARHEREAEARYRACLAQPRKKKAPTGPLGLGDLSCEQIRESGGFNSSDLGFEVGPYYSPPCGLNIEYPETAMARLSGAPFRTLADIFEVHDLATGARSDVLLALVARRCGSLRLEVPASRARNNDTGRGSLRGYDKSPPRRVLRAGALVTWPAGTYAGKVTGAGVVLEKELTPVRGGRLCVRVAPYSEPLCLAEKDVCPSTGCKP